MNKPLDELPAPVYPTAAVNPLPISKLAPAAVPLPEPRGAVAAPQSSRVFPGPPYTQAVL